MTALEGAPCISSCQKASTTRCGSAGAMSAIATCETGSRSSAGRCGCRRSTSTLRQLPISRSRTCRMARSCSSTGWSRSGRRQRSRSPRSGCASWCSPTWCRPPSPTRFRDDVDGERRALWVARSVIATSDWTRSELIAPRSRSVQPHRRRAARLRRGGAGDRYADRGCPAVRGSRRAAQGSGHAHRSARATRAPHAVDVHHRRARLRAGRTSRSAISGAGRRRRASRIASSWRASSAATSWMRPTVVPICWSRPRAPRATAWRSPTRCAAASR